MQEVCNGFVGNVDRKSDEAQAYYSQCALFVALALVNVSVNSHPPKQRRTRCHFNETVNSKSYERNATSNCAYNDGYEALQSVPSNRKVFEVSASSRDCCPRHYTAFGHVDRLPR